MATVTIRMDDEEKTMLDHLLDDIGMNISTFYMIYTKRFLRERKIPFEIGSPDPFYLKENMAALERSEQQIRDGKVITKTLEELEAMEHE